MADPSPHTAVRNRLLAALPVQEQTALLAKLKSVSFEPRTVVYEQGERMDHVYFPESGVLSLIHVMEDGTTVAVAAIGREGLLGVPVLHTATGAVAKAVVQFGGIAHAMRTERFEEEVAGSPSLRALLEHYTRAFLVQVVRSAGCNLFHSVKQRCARWLLMSHDGAGTDEFPCTHESLADLLGIQRQTATTALRRLEQSKIVKLRRGQIRIIDRRQLESVSCECYRAVRRELDLFLAD
ncbi:Crp/Fnr family transcriptional regulator [Candidatus Nitrospira bockiana]